MRQSAVSGELVPDKHVVERFRQFVEGDAEGDEEEEEVEDAYEAALEQRVLEGGLDVWDMLAEGEPYGIGPPGRSAPQVGVYG
jgi:hypothetical protein